MQISKRVYNFAREAALFSVVLAVTNIFADWPLWFTAVPVVLSLACVIIVWLYIKQLNDRINDYFRPL